MQFPFPRVVGVDLASVAARTGVVTLEWSGDGFEATLAADASDVGLVGLVDEGTLVGLDAPLGWPEEFVRAIGEHARFLPWPARTAPEGSPEREHLRLRRTDRFVRALQLGSTPLSVSSDLIGVVAMRAALLQSAWSIAWGQREPRDGSGRLVETYPAAALRAWGLLAAKGVRYKGGGPRGEVANQLKERQRMIEEVAAQCAAWLRIAAPLRDAAIRSDHALDALICALVALATKLDATLPPPLADRDAARHEGWIHVPSCPLLELGELLLTTVSSRGAI
jgi:predicted nuclease with RNAse H fold